MSDDKNQPTMKGTEDLILALLTTANMTPSELCNKLTITSESTVKNAIWRLIDRGAVVLTVDRKLGLPKPKPAVVEDPPKKWFSFFFYDITMGLLKIIAPLTRYVASLQNITLRKLATAYDSDFERAITAEGTEFLKNRSRK